MKIINSQQKSEISDAVRSKLAMVVPIIEAFLYSLSRDRIKRLGGIKSLTLWDVAREYRDGAGDTGICFEYAVHNAIATNNEIIRDMADRVLSKFCHINQGANSILFGPEKDGVIPVVESVQNALTDDSILYVGNAGRPPKLKRYIPQIVRAFRRHEERNRLPRSISGLWKADLFLGNPNSEQWVGTTVKINPTQLVGARGLRIGIYPKINAKDIPRLDSDLNLVRMPLPYDGQFMEMFYKSFYLTRAFMKADAKVPLPAFLPDAEDRFISQELEARREFPIVQVLEVLRSMAQPDLIEPTTVEDLEIDAEISEAEGFNDNPSKKSESNFPSITPIPLQV